MGTRSNRLGEAVQTSTYTLCFELKYEQYQILSENFQFFVVKFSIFMSRCVFVKSNVNMAKLELFFS